MTAAHDGPAEHLAAAIAAFRRRAWAAADAGTERDVRKARVAARRLRAILRLATAPEIEALRDEIADLASVLGKLRDLDVQVAAIESERASADEPLRQVALAAGYLPTNASKLFDRICGGQATVNKKPRKARMTSPLSCCVEKQFGGTLGLRLGNREGLRGCHSNVQRARLKDGIQRFTRSTRMS